MQTFIEGLILCDVIILRWHYFGIFLSSGAAKITAEKYAGMCAAITDTAH